MNGFTSHNDEITKVRDAIAGLYALGNLLRCSGVLNDEMGHFSLTLTKYEFDTSLFAKKPGEYTGLFQPSCQPWMSNHCRTSKLTLSATVIPAWMSIKPVVLPLLILSITWYFSSHLLPNLPNLASSAALS